MMPPGDKGRPLPHDTSDFQRWLAERIDRIDRKIDERVDDIETEIQATRHAQRGSLETLTLQVVELVGSQGHIAQAVGEINGWRAEDGPLDRRFRRHDSRLVEGERWRFTVKGALVAVGLFSPILTGVAVGVALKLVT